MYRIICQLLMPFFPKMSEFLFIYFCYIYSGLVSPSRLSLLMCGLQNCEDNTCLKFMACIKINCLPSLEVIFAHSNVNSMSACLINICRSIREETSCYRQCARTLPAIFSHRVWEETNDRRTTLPKKWMVPIGLTTKGTFQLNDDQHDLSGWDTTWLSTFDVQERVGNRDEDDCDIKCKLTYAVSHIGEQCVRLQCINFISMEEIMACSVLKCGFPEIIASHQQNTQIVLKSSRMLKAKSKRWTERVCMETHCGYFTSNSPRYFMCGSQFCHGG